MSHVWVLCASGEAVWGVPVCNGRPEKNHEKNSQVKSAVTIVIQAGMHTLIKNVINIIL